MADVQEKIQEETLEGSETSENNTLSEPEIIEDSSSDVPQDDECVNSSLCMIKLRLS